MGNRLNKGKTNSTTTLDYRKKEGTTASGRQLPQMLRSFQPIPELPAFLRSSVSGPGLGYFLSSVSLVRLLLRRLPAYRNAAKKLRRPLDEQIKKLFLDRRDKVRDLLSDSATKGISTVLLRIMKHERTIARTEAYDSFMLRWIEVAVASAFLSVNLGLIGHEWRALNAEFHRQWPSGHAYYSNVTWFSTVTAVAFFLCYRLYRVAMVWWPNVSIVVKTVIFLPAVILSQGLVLWISLDVLHLQHLSLLFQRLAATSPFESAILVALATSVNTGLWFLGLALAEFIALRLSLLQRNLRYSEAVLVTDLISVMFLAQENKSWRGPLLCKVPMMLLLEEAACCLGYFIPRSLQCGDPIIDRWKKDRYALIAKSIRGLKMWLMMPKFDTKNQFQERIVQILVMTCCGDWDNLVSLADEDARNSLFLFTENQLEKNWAVIPFRYTRLRTWLFSAGIGALIYAMTALIALLPHMKIEGYVYWLGPGYALLSLVLDLDPSLGAKIEMAKGLREGFFQHETTEKNATN